MVAKIIWLVCVGGSALLFTGLAIYAKNRKEPMWFWSGSTVPNYRIKDIPAYNSANCKMWCLYSIPYWISALAFFWFPVFAAIVLVTAATAGLVWIIRYYEKILEKYER